MLAALNEKNKLLIADKKLIKSECYYCPSCNNRVYLKTGDIMRPHFAHYKKEDCSVFTEGETEEHLNGKLALASFFKELDYRVEIEAYLTELKQRPDLLIEKNEVKIAIEFQCSSITIKKLIERTTGYREAGYQIIWILGSRFHYRNSLTNLHKASLYYHLKTNNYLLIHYYTVRKELSIHYNFRIDDYGKMQAERSRLIVSDLNPNNLENQKNKIRKHQKSNWFVHAHYQLSKSLRYPHKQLLDFLSLIYLKNENIISIPVEIYARVPHEWMIQSFHMHWKYQLLIWVESHSVKEVITKNRLKAWVNERQARKEVIHSLIPGINNEQKMLPYYEFLNLLAENNLVKKITTNKWSYQRAAKRFTNLEEKFEQKIRH